MTKKQAILITGCDSGFGYSLACHLASKHPEFLTIACCYSMNSEGAQNLESKSVTVLPLDVTDDNSIEILKNQVDILLEQHNGELWTLVNNAASLVFGKRHLVC